MGRIVRANAAALDIISDVGVTLHKATLREGIWAEEAEEALGDVVRLIDAGSIPLAQAEQDLVKASARLAFVAKEIDLLVGGFYYEQWQSLGRPQHDARLRILYPTGPSYWTSGPVEGLPMQLELFAALQSKHVHPRLSSARCDEIAESVIRAHQRLVPALAAFRAPEARATHGRSMRAAMARVAQNDLSKLKRTMLGHGFREPEVHEVIPDRPPGSSTARKGATPVPTPAPEVPPEVTPEPAVDADEAEVA